MRRNKAFKRGRVVAILLACGIGYLIGGWHSVALRSADLSAAETVALRFPQDWSDTSPATLASVISPVSSANAAGAKSAVSAVSAVSSVQFALLNPEPMVPQAVAQATVQTAALEQVGVVPAPAAGEPPQPPPLRAAAPPPASAAKAAAVAARHRADRPGFLLNDAQIASIKERLSLTPDQQQMWPAVEAALRNIAYAHAKEEHRQGNAGVVQAAAVDPNSVEVQGLKSAAVPLIMSFNSEQKEEVRNLAHVMGLDQFATQF